MPKERSIPCIRCGTLLWPDNRCPDPPHARLCRGCTASAKVDPLTWSLDRHGPVSSLILERCGSCDATPTVEATFPDGGGPRAVSWVHETGCPTNPRDGLAPARPGPAPRGPVAQASLAEMAELGVVDQVEISEVLQVAGALDDTTTSIAKREVLGRALAALLSGLDGPGSADGERLEVLRRRRRRVVQRSLLAVVSGAAAGGES